MGAAVSTAVSSQYPVLVVYMETPVDLLIDVVVVPVVVVVVFSSFTLLEQKVI